MNRAFNIVMVAVLGVLLAGCGSPTWQGLARSELAAEQAGVAAAWLGLTIQHTADADSFIRDGVNHWPRIEKNHERYTDLADDARRFIEAGQHTSYLFNSFECVPLAKQIGQDKADFCPFLTEHDETWRRSAPGLTIFSLARAVPASG